MNNEFSPTLGVLRGQQVEQGLAQAQLEGMSLRERLALKKAAGQLGSQNYFAGYEGVPGAERPAYLKDAWANADPAQALQLEALVAEPFKVQRGIETAGKIEQAKKSADYNEMSNMIERFRRTPEGQRMTNAMGDRLAPPSPQTTATPSSPAVGEMPIATPSDLSQLPGDQESLEVSPMGPKWSVKPLTPFDRYTKVGEATARTAATQQARDTYNQNAYQNAVGNVQKAQQTLREAQAAQFENPAAAGQVNMAHRELLARRKEFDTLVRQMAHPPSAQAVPAQDMPAGETAGDLTGYDPQGELARVPPAAPSSGTVQPAQAPSMPPSPRTLAPAPPSTSPFGIPGAEQLSGHMQQEVGKKEVIVARDRALGQQVVRSVIDSLREQYTKLNAMGGITNTEKDAAGNIVAGSSASSPGQFAGKLLGTKSQSLRNTIAQQRPLLMQAMMKASGMTAKQMDSNVELKLWLATATDPTLDFQTNMKALDTLEQLYGQGAGTAAPATTMTPGVPGFHDPAKQQRYEKWKQQHTP